MMFKMLVKITGVSLVYAKHNLALFICLFLPVLVGSYFPDQEAKLVLVVEVQHPNPWTTREFPTGCFKNKQLDRSFRIFSRLEIIQRFFFNCLLVLSPKMFRHEYIGFITLFTKCLLFIYSSESKQPSLHNHYHLYSRLWSQLTYASKWSRRVLWPFEKWPLLRSK